MKTVNAFIKNKYVRRIFISFFILITSMYLLFSCFSRTASKSFTASVANVPYDAIIVPGYPLKDSIWDDVMKIRVYWSKYLYEQGYTGHIIYSGSAVYTPYVESKVMRAYAEAIGVPSDIIYTETNAEHSTENLFYAYKLAKRQGFNKIALATDPFQNAFLKKFAKKKKLDIAFLPILFDTLSQIDKIDPPVDVSGAYIKNFVALPDREGFFKRFKGTLGKNMKEELIEMNTEEILIEDTSASVE